MPRLRRIEIDFDVHKKIEEARRSFDDSPNAVLRRLLDIADDDSSSQHFLQSDGVQVLSGERPGLMSGRSLSDEDSEQEWWGKGVTLPHGTELRMEYRGRLYSGVIENGRWVVEGERFGSPSAAASGVARTKDGKRTNLDGWRYWSVRRPMDEDWIPINQLRPSM
ncbi:MAG: hypothetical protein OXL41_00150 [Nitrospinae bacterium]|nr:hypothetical protein [Nitrospinota bacterium]